MKLFAFLLFAFLFRFKRLTKILKYIFISEIWHWLTALMKWFKKLIYWLAGTIIIAFLPMKLLEEKRERELVTQNISFRSIRSQKLFQIGVLKNFAIFRGKCLCWSLVLSSYTPEYSNTGVFLWILRSFYKRLFFAEHLWWLFLLFWLVIEWKYVTTLMFLNIAPVLNETFDHDDFGNNSLNNCRISMFTNCHELGMNCVLVY